MRRVDLGHAARWEYFRVNYGRYSNAEGKAKGGMLDEFCLNTGYHRKYAIRLLNGPPPGKSEEARGRGRKPQYSPGVVSVLIGVTFHPQIRNLLFTTNQHFSRSDNN